MNWDAGGSNSYRMGAEGKFDLMLAPSHNPDLLRRESTSSRTSEPGGILVSRTKLSNDGKPPKVSVLSSRKSSSTPSLSEPLDAHSSVASTEQASSAENLTSAIKLTAESVAESVLNLASEAAVRVTVDPASEENNQLASASTEASVMVHNADIGPPLTSVLAGISEHEGASAPAPTPNHTGSPTGIQTPSEVVEEEMDGAHATEVTDATPKELLSNKDIPFGAPMRKVGRTDPTDRQNNQNRQTPVNPMSISVPNLTSNMEQTVSLLESFAAVARRNLGNSANNMRTNANSLVRLALSSGSPGKWMHFENIKLKILVKVIIMLPGSCKMKNRMTCP